MSGDPLAAGLITQIDEPGVGGFVLGELIRGVNDDTSRPVLYLTGQLGNLDEGDGKKHQVGIGRRATVPAEAPSPSSSTSSVNVSGPRLLLSTTGIRTDNARVATARPTDPDPMIPTLANKMCLFSVRSQHPR